MRLYGFVLSAVTEFLAAIVMFFFAGQFADKHFNSGSKWTTIGAVVGTILGFILLITRLQASIKKEDEDKH